MSAIGCQSGGIVDRKLGTLSKGLGLPAGDFGKLLTGRLVHLLRHLDQLDDVRHPTVCGREWRIPFAGIALSLPLTCGWGRYVAADAQTGQQLSLVRDVTMRR